MKIALSRAQLVYEVALKAPAFELSTNAVQTVRALHEAFSGRFRATPADIYVANAARLSEWAVRLSLFAGQWSVEIQFGGYRVTCNGLTNDSDMELAVDCIGKTEGVAAAVMSSSVANLTVGRMSGWYWCDGGPSAVAPHLGRFAPSNLAIVAGFEGAESTLFNVSGSLSNYHEKWSTKVLIEPSTADYGDLFFQIESRYIEGGRYNTFDEKRGHFSRMSAAVLKQVDLEFGDVNRNG